MGYSHHSIDISGYVIIKSAGLIWGFWGNFFGDLGGVATIKMLRIFYKAVLTQQAFGSK